ncbi:response regulator [Paraburkholderia guartelaensis]|uniref:Response regulator n=1 Tax=Paraburkholderia guartelaensis TaxID=2546446 RepID=A0A4R5L4S1_9BURK|nr:response regulator [Paraburkholderia guartelaensis]
MRHAEGGQGATHRDQPGRRRGRPWHGPALPRRGSLRPSRCRSPPASRRAPCAQPEDSCRPRCSGFGTADDGPSGLRTAAESSPDVILLDIGLPGMNGLDVARELQALSPKHPLVLFALTGFGSVEDMSRSAETDFSRHLVKRVDPDMLIELLRGIGASRYAEKDAR